MPKEKELENLLNLLCVKLGFCLPLKAHSRFVKFPPKTAEKFTKAVIVAEGLNVATIDTSLYKSILYEVEKVFN